MTTVRLQTEETKRMRKQGYNIYTSSVLVIEKDQNSSKVKLEGPK